MSAMIENILRNASEREISDLFLSAGKTPAMRIHGQVIPQEKFAPVTAEELDRFRVRMQKKYSRGIQTSRETDSR